MRRGHQGDNQSAQALGVRPSFGPQAPPLETPGGTIRERLSQLSAVQAIPAVATNSTGQRGAIHTQPCPNSGQTTETCANKMVFVLTFV